ncbi:DUF2309 domain-containing protein [Halonotius terrestris]|uniref:Probable inorganic carbon transporter subunit DabA n=1 Tax=Halonotius terrestris TaxID=2487750 RepID=A0A8J8P819_9EURY|nr:DUF2309 domain-containing protein [Halonotius terrestris]TQQ79937.1 DUF2309 domain-containing protein [Halonotius terrestris]
MSTESTIHDSIEGAATTVGSVWPIHSFVTANPLSGFEDQPFPEAVAEATDLLGGRGYPSAETFRTALERGQIDEATLRSELDDRGYEADPETLLDRLAEADHSDIDGSDEETDTDRVDAVLTKWLAAFLDEGRAHWPMPNREEGFYSAFRELADHDGEIPDRGIAADLPESPTVAIEAVVNSHPEDQWDAIFEKQLAALPGWTGFIKQRADAGSEWQSEYPITVEGYLAVRLALLDAFDVDIEPSEEQTEPEPADEIAEAFLSAWEATYREELVDTVASESEKLADSEGSGRPDAQLTFCIDTRSEVIRRHIESTGDYETHGYAGFFGIPIEYNGYESEVPVEACPPILDPQHRITEQPTDDETQASHDRLSGVRDAAHEVIETLQANAASAYGYVESSGAGYGLALAARTLVPGRVHDLFDAVDDSEPDSHEFCDPLVHHQHTYAGDLPVGLTTEEKVEYAATAFDLMGFKQFGRVVAFVGHASETENNPYDSSLDCGACAGNPGGPNARVLASICNDDEVQEALREQGHDIPEDTVFVAGEHNTTTDEIELFADDVPASHDKDIDQLRADLAAARENATAERADAMGAETGDAIGETERRAADWAETRPEWGLAGNASFVIGPRELTEDVNLDGRAFLHSYDHATDPDGDALEAILAGPMVVTQWINNQYYFSTVDSGVYGSGSKITHNPVGNVGVYQGNGGDLLTGLPLQSVAAGPDDPYHQPLRLSTVVHAPVDRVDEILADHERLTTLLDNGWLSLTVVDPTRGHDAFHYDGELSWTGPEDIEPEPAAAEPGAVPADD